MRLEGGAGALTRHAELTRNPKNKPYLEKVKGEKESIVTSFSSVVHKGGQF